MEFEDMQRIWDKQNQEPLYAVNELALHKQIRKKSVKIGRNLDKLEYGLIGTNIVIALLHIADAIRDGKAWYYIAIACILIVVALYAFSLRRLRQQKHDQFPPTMVGELDKAIGQLDFLIERTQTMFWWYITPVFSVYAATIYLDRNEHWQWLVAAVVAMGVATHWLSKWEIRCWHLPKKQDLLTLRELLTQPL